MATLIRIVFAVNALVFFSLLVLYLYVPEFPARSVSSFDTTAAQLHTTAFEAVSTHWGERMDAIGAEAAYAEFLEAYSTSTAIDMQHSFAHLFGDMLYRKRGVSGVSVCDASFGFGCYHSFFGRAIAENGLDVVAALDAECVSAYGLRGLGCSHGIGHGVMAYVGFGHLAEALKACATLSWQGPIGGCTSGVFMEFNFRTMEGPTASHRQLDAEGLQYPCNYVSERFKKACYFEQVVWWWTLYERREGQSRAEALATAGSLCGELSDVGLMSACFWGAGNDVAARTVFDIDTIISYCTLMPAQGVALCLQGASRLTSAEPEHADDWQQICDGLQGESLEICMSPHDFI